MDSLRQLRDSTESIVVAGTGPLRSSEGIAALLSNCGNEISASQQLDLEPAVVERLAFCAQDISPFTCDDPSFPDAFKDVRESSAIANPPKSIANRFVAAHVATRAWNYIQNKAQLPRASVCARKENEAAFNQPTNEHCTERCFP